MFPSESNLVDWGRGILLANLSRLHDQYKYCNESEILLNIFNEMDK